MINKNSMPVNTRGHMSMHSHMSPRIYRHIARVTRAEQREGVARCSKLVQAYCMPVLSI